MRIVTFGHFSILHVGHIHLFELSKQLHNDSHLTVAVAVDKVVRAVKPDPVFSLQDRLKLISACRYVDSVIPYGADVSDNDLLKTKTDYNKHCQLLHETENNVVNMLKADAITFGEDKNSRFYKHIKRDVLLIQLPRLESQINSSEIIKRIKHNNDR